jgi:hypothetical protein
MKKAAWLYGSGLVLFTLPTALNIYLLMPLPGSQGLDSIGVAYRIYHWVPPLQMAGAALALVGLVALARGSLRRVGWALAALGLIGAGLVFYGAHELDPARMFQPMATVAFERGTSEALPGTTLVMGIVDGQEARAYPIRLLAYHHRVEDTLGGEPIWVTYCTMCRTGKIFRPVVGGRELSFDLVGALRFNSVYEDRETGSWWYQANGRAAAGPNLPIRERPCRYFQCSIAFCDNGAVIVPQCNLRSTVRERIRLRMEATVERVIIL